MRTDRYGDPLPPGALARLGTSRLCHHGANWLAFSPDGEKLASLDSYTFTLCVWEVKTGEQIGRVETLHPTLNLGYGSGASLLAFSPRGDVLAVCGRDGSMRLWDVTARRLRHTIRGTTRTFETLAFSPDGRRLAAGGLGGTVHILDPGEGKVLAQWGALPSVSFLTYSADGKTLLSASCDRQDWHKKTFCQWDAASGRTRGDHTFVPDSDWVGELSPDGRLFAVPLADGTSIRLFDPLTGEEVRRTQGRASRPAQVAFSGDGRFLTATCDDGIVRVWATATGEMVHRFRGLSTSFKRVALSHKGDLLALVGRADWAIHVWDLSRERELNTFGGHRGGKLTVAFSADGKTVATTSEDTIYSTRVREWADWSLRRWDALSGEERGVTRRNLEGEVRLTAFSADGRLLATVRHDGTLRLWDVAGGEELRRWKVPAREGTKSPWNLLIRGVVFTPDGRTLLATDGATIYRWRTATGEELPSVPCGVLDPSAGCAIAPDGQTLLVRYSDRGLSRLALVDLASGRQLRQLPASRDIRTCPVFSPDGRALAVPGKEGILLLETESGQERGRLVCGSPGGATLVFSPDGELLASAAHLDGRVRLWDLSGGTLLHEFGGNPLRSSSLAFSPDGARLASAGFDSTVLIWDVSGCRRGAEAAPRLSPDDLEGLWLDLSGVSASRAYRAIWKLAAAPRQSVPFLKDRLKVPPPLDEKQVAKLIGALDDDRFAVREKATQELLRLGPKAEPALRRALGQRPSPEQRRRLQQLLDRLTAPDAPTSPSAELVALRVLEALEKSNGSEAREVIGRWAHATPETRLTRDARASLERLVKRKPVRP